MCVPVFSVPGTLTTTPSWSGCGARIELDQRGHWWVRFEGGLTLSLGREDRDGRMGQFLRVYPRLIADPARQPERVDMRYEHGFAVQWRESEADTTAAVRPQLQEKV